MGQTPPLLVACCGLVALAAALGIGRFVYTPILPAMAAALHMSKSQAGFIASVNFLGYLVGAMAATLPVFGAARRFWLVVGLLLNAATLIGMGLTTSLLGFGVLRGLSGVSSGFVMVFGSSIVMERLVASGRPGLASVHFMGPGTGITLSAILVAWLGHVGIGWQGEWLANGGVAALAAVFVMAVLPADTAPTAVGAAKPAASGRIDRPIVLFTIAYGLIGFGYVITSTFIVAQVRDTPDIAAWEPYVWVLVGLAALPSAAFWSFWTRRIGAMPAFAVAAVAEAIGVAASALSPTFAGIALAAILVGGTFIGLTAMGLVAIRGMMPGDSRRGIGLLTAAFGIGQIIGPLYAGFLHDMTGSFDGATYSAAAALLVSAGLSLLVRR
jgi:predicted MFS family arabinose efflux permease